MHQTSFRSQAAGAETSRVEAAECLVQDEIALLNNAVLLGTSSDYF